MTQNTAGEANTDPASTEGGLGDETKKPRIDWADPEVPVGNAPPLPRWPLALAGVLWLAWVVFLFVVMIASRHATTV